MAGDCRPFDLRVSTYVHDIISHDHTTYQGRYEYVSRCIYAWPVGPVYHRPRSNNPSRAAAMHHLMSLSRMPILRGLIKHKPKSRASPAVLCCALLLTVVALIESITSTALSRCHQASRTDDCIHFAWRTREDIPSCSTTMNTICTKKIQQ